MYFMGFHSILFILCLCSKSHLQYAINTDSILLKGMNSLWFIIKKYNSKVKDSKLCYDNVSNAAS